MDKFVIFHFKTINNVDLRFFLIIPWVLRMDYAHRSIDKIVPTLLSIYPLRTLLSTNTRTKVIKQMFQTVIFIEKHVGVQTKYTAYYRFNERDRQWRIQTGMDSSWENNSSFSCVALKKVQFKCPLAKSHIHLWYV